MSFFSIAQRHRFSLFILSIWVIVAFICHQDAGFSGEKADFSPRLHNFDSEKSHKTLVAKETPNLAITANIRKTVLDNGLTVLTKEVHNAPVVTVQVWYKFGSGQEAPGVNGIAHQLEHLMFKGTSNRPIQFGRLFSALGSDSNAFTSYDQTAYYNTAERDKLTALLTLEADRMKNSLIDPQQLASEKRVVISELQGYENSPEYRLNRAVMMSVFPDHPYRLPIGGTKADVEKFTVAQVREYYQKFYSPDNAVLVIVGDFDTAQTLKKVQTFFGKVPKRQYSPHNLITPSPAATPAPVIKLQEPGGNPLLQLIYPLPQINQPDIPALEVMDYILTAGKNSYLYRELVESGLANDVSANVASLRAGGWYEILVTSAGGQDLTKLDAAVIKALDKLAKVGLTKEQVERAKTQLTASVILNNRDITNQAMQLGNDQITTDNYQYTENHLVNIRKVRVTDVINVINKYLQPAARKVGFFEPTKQVVTVQSSSYSTPTQENFGTDVAVVPAEVQQYLPPLDILPKAEKRQIPQQLQLANGLRILLLPDKTTPTVTLSGNIKAGTEFESDNQGGLASLVAANLMNGTKTQDMRTIAQGLEAKGANLNFEAYREGVRIKGSSLAVDLPILLGTLTDVIRNSTFPEKEFALARQQALTSLDSDLDDPDKVANRIFVQSIYPKKHPLHTFPTAESISKIQRQDVIGFRAQHYRPDTTVLAIVGDFDVNKVRSLIQAKLGDWQVKGKPPRVKYPNVGMPKNVVNVNPVVPGKPQAITYMGYTGINRQDKRFYAAMILNQILGGDTLSSRLGAEVRDRQGLTYGIYSNFITGKNVGTFLIEMQTSPEDAPKAISSTRNLLKQVHQQGVTPIEVETAKRNLISNYNISLANPEQLSQKMVMNEVYGLNQVELRSFTSKIEQVNLNQVNQAARELLHPDKIVVVTAGPPILAHKKIK
ncbi:insulinase family protein [Dolichospermum sp. LEGE 00240]|uniref:M16 family metallopeptidase n=1 Tax=Dolichospermum sp. LEGE 00240 TaxID=1828603 RepID=UPI00187DFCCF|nr:pitrilysin family protein [Dolichospermum sp. LEGE 00240]MBE9247899.1 insulinase family protein [Dolichospermum sp. LEGE 00240]MDM3859872.1 pitrilysin family protein [Aphanizomenon gracile PMC644.10]